MVKANSYKLEECTTTQDLLDKGFRGGVWQSKYKGVECLRKSIKLNYTIELELTVKTNPMEFDDFEDVLVLDSSFCQPYTPFYGSNYKQNISNFEFLESVILEYNEAMDSLGVFKSV